MEIKKGEIWRVRTSESENIIRVLDDIPDTGKDQDFNAEVFEANFRPVKKEDFDEGKKILFKTKSIRWREKID